MDMLIERKPYMKQLRDLQNEHIIKIISGVRRSGKSTLLEMFANELRKTVTEAQIQFYNFEDPDNLVWKDRWLDLYQHIVSQMVVGKQNYIFLDEIQNIGNFEQLADGLFIKAGIDLYITGSNAYFLSSDIATLLSGRMFEIKVLPLSFSEYLSSFEDKTDLTVKFQRFMKYGGLPRVLDFGTDDELIVEYLQGIYNTVLLKDVMKRSGITDQEVLIDVSSFMLDNIGNITASKRIADTLTSRGRAISHSTVDKYIMALSESLLFYAVDKIGLKGKKRLYSQKKYYSSDVGFRQLVIGARQTEIDRGHLLENIVYLELLRRHIKVEFGRADDKEVDFVVLTKEGHVEYYQVAWTVRGEETRAREIAPLNAIKDHNSKYLLTLDTEEPVENGIKQKYVIDWLLESY